MHISLDPLHFNSIVAPYSSYYFETIYSLNNYCITNYYSEVTERLYCGSSACLIFTHSSWFCFLESFLFDVIHSLLAASAYLLTIDDYLNIESSCRLFLEAILQAGPKLPCTSISFDYADCFTDIKIGN